MKILLVGNYRADEQYSMLGFEAALASGFRQEGVDCRISCPQVRMAHLPATRNLRKWLAYVDKYMLFPRELRRAMHDADIVHLCDQGNALYLRHLQDKPHLVTCHDLLAIRASLGEIPGWNMSPSGRTYQSIIRKSLSLAREVVCVSRATQRDFQRLISGNARTRLIPNSPYRPYHRIDRPEATLRLKDVGFDPSLPFLLHLGGNQPYKNRLGAVRIHQGLRRVLEDPPRLVLAGHPLSPVIQDAAADDLASGQIVHLPKPSDGQVEALYSLAEGLLYPSVAEGFGLPILEAMRCGCPVFTSNREPMTEVGKDAAVTFDPDDPAQAAATIAANWSRRAEMAALGLALSAERSPIEMASAYLDAYREVLA